MSDLLARLREAQALAKSGRACTACHPTFREPLRKMMQGAIDEALKVSVRAFYVVLRDDFGLEIGQSALQKHITEHEEGLWQRLREAGCVRR